MLGLTVLIALVLAQANGMFAFDETPAPRAAGDDNAATGEVNKRGSDKTDYDAIATGVWERPFDKEPPKLRDGVAYEAGELTLTDCTLTLRSHYGRDFIIRAQVAPTALSQTLHLRGDRDTNIAEPAGSFYAGWLNGHVARRGIGFADGAGGWEDFTTERLLTLPLESDGYLELAMAAVGDELTLYINGQLVAEASDDRLKQGYIRLGAREGATTFRDIEVMRLDTTDE
jgi:hypothetical protein